MRFIRLQAGGESPLRYPSYPWRIQEMLGLAGVTTVRQHQVTVALMTSVPFLDSEWARV